MIFKVKDSDFAEIQEILNEFMKKTKDTYILVSVIYENKDDIEMRLFLMLN